MSIHTISLIIMYDKQLIINDTWSKLDFKV